MRPVPRQRLTLARSKSTLARFASEKRGAVALEFGLVAIPFFFTLVAIFQVGFNYYQMACLDSAAHAGSRAVMTGIVQQNGLSVAQFVQQYICPSLQAPMSCSSVVVNVAVVLPAATATTAVGMPASPIPAVSPSAYWSNFVNGAGTGLVVPSTTQSSNTFCPGNPGDFVVVQVLYPVPFFSRILNPSGAGSQWEMNTATFVNEPYPNPQTYAGCS
ncbi:MAG TPA: TadE/TadG family type IV pilus assembly protein [Methylocystis sp.]|nr:TadE/TadG family type IV pilus assembly protein [Methylocystis sp.]